MVMSDRIALLRSGELEQVAAPREIYSRPATAYVAQFIGHTNLLAAEVRGGSPLLAAIVAVQLADGRPYSLATENIVVVSPALLLFLARACARKGSEPGVPRSHRVDSMQCAEGLVLVVRTPSGMAATLRSSWSSLLRMPFRCASLRKELIVLRAYKTAVTLPPLVWVAAFLLTRIC